MLVEPSHCYIAAEIGINHNGDLALAKRSIEAAKACGVDGVKFQNYRTEDFLLDRSLTYSYVSQGRAVTESQFEMFKRNELSDADVRALHAHAMAVGVDFFSTPTSANGVQLLDSLGCRYIKNGSDYLTNLPLIRSMAASKATTVLSTGMATMSDVATAVDAFHEAGGRELILLVCTSSYPTPPDQAHLRRIETLRAAFGVPVGFSDHTEGTTASVLSIALGAVFVEKHFTLDRELPGPDHRFSSDPVEMAAMVKEIRAASRMLGSPQVRPSEAEQNGRQNYRLSCFANTDLPSGAVIADSHISFCRPGTGLPPSASAWLTGRVLRRAVKAGQMLAFADLA